MRVNAEDSVLFLLRTGQCLAKISEDDFTAAVIGLAQKNGWRVAHFRKARTKNGWRTAVSGDGKGWPDLVLVKGEWIIAAELKVKRNKTTPEQEQWLEVLKAAGCRVAVWRPEHWPAIEETLEA